LNIELPHNWSPRPGQVNLWKFFQGPEEGKRAAVVAHRRWGKDLTAINLIAPKLFQRVGTYWHLLPTYKQGRAIVWNGFTRDGRAFLDHFPKQLVENRLNNEMRLHFYHPTKRGAEGSIYQVVGTDDVNSLVGTNPIGCVFSEYSLHNPAAWEYIRPILRENGGWALFIYTPRGHNHGYKLLRDAKNAGWFTEVHKAGSGPEGSKRHDGSPVVPDEAIEQERLAGMPEEMIQQEFFCSFEASMVGAYYSKQMEAAEKEGRICQVGYEPKLPVHTAWDIGVKDSTSIVFFQTYGLEVRVIDYYETSGEGLPHYVRELKSKEYVYGTHYMPHDAKVREWTSGKSRVEVARGLGLKVRILPQIEEKQDAIEQVRNILPRCIFNGSKCERLIDALKTYRKEWDDERRVFKDSPLHDWSSNGADAFSYMCWSIPRRSKMDKDDLPQPTAVDDYSYV
jgi:phage terminase large subunit